MRQAELTDHAASMCRRVNEFWSGHEPRVFDGSCRLGILSRPSVFAPKPMTIAEAALEPPAVWAAGAAAGCMPAGVTKGAAQAR